MSDLNAPARTVICFADWEMPLMKKELFKELLESVKQAKAIERGHMKPSRVFNVKPQTPVCRVRSKLGLS